MSGSPDLQQAYAEAVEILGVEKRDLLLDAMEAYLPTLRGRVKIARAEAKPDKTKILFEGQPCRKCQTPVVRREHKKPPKRKPGGYYFSYWMACPNRQCNTLYMVESAKVWFDSEPPREEP